MSKLVSIDMRINHSDWDDWAGSLEQDVQTALNTASGYTRSGSIDLLLTGDDEIQSLNEHWRGKPKPTDVLSFPTEENPSQSDFLGDIVISHGVMSRDATISSKDLKAHFAHLIVHGFLHLLGFDHIEPSEADEMEALEIKILADMGLPNPYSDYDQKQG